MGAYATALMVLHTPIPWYFAIPIAVLIAGMAALLLGAVMLRLRGIMFALGMLGLARISRSSPPTGRSQAVLSA